MSQIICIAGPTASGKTALSIALAKELDGEVVSCDSMQVYKYMDIGTAKPSLEERDGVPTTCWMLLIPRRISPSAGTVKWQRLL